MSQQRRQVIMLVVLLVALAYVVGRQVLPALRGGGGPQGRRVAAGPAGGLMAAGAEVTELRLADLEHKPANYKPGRDPFRFAPRPRPLPRPQPKPDPDAGRRAAAAAQAARQKQQQAAVPPGPQPPPVSLVYLGSFGIPGREIAVFSNGQEIFNAFQGGVVQKDFVVRRIGFESADVGFVDFPDAPPKRLAIGG